MFKPIYFLQYIQNLSHVFIEKFHLDPFPNLKQYQTKFVPLRENLLYKNIANKVERIHVRTCINLSYKQKDTKVHFCITS